MDSRPRTRSRPSTIRTCEAVTDVAPAAPRHASMHALSACAPRCRRPGRRLAAGPHAWLTCPTHMGHDNNHAAIGRPMPIA
jgi:hypothetical protein